jgi:immunity protein 5 of polymorphic toxin system
MGSPSVRLGVDDHRSLALWAADCAEHVLGVFEKTCPDDDRPRKAVEAARAWARGEITVGIARKAALAAHDAARHTADPAARAAAQAASHAAMTADAAGHAAHAATYAVTAVSSSEVSDPAAAAGERRWQHQQVPEHLVRVAFPA